MLEFSKYILCNVSFDESLFFKELRKLICWSKNDGLNDLRSWCIENFGSQYGEKIIKEFNASE